MDNYVGCSDQCHLCRPLFTAEEQAACSDNKDIIRNAFIAGAEFMKKEMEHEQRFIPVEEELPREYARILIKTSNSYLYIGIYSEKKDYCKWFDGNEPDIDFQIEDEVVAWKYLEY